MEQIYSVMLDVLQRATELPAVPKGSEEGGQNAGQFKDLLQHKREDAVSAQDGKENDSSAPSNIMEDGAEENVVLAQELLASQFTPAGFIGVLPNQIIVSEETDMPPAALQEAAPLESVVMPAEQFAAQTGEEILLPAQAAGQTEQADTTVQLETAEPSQLLQEAVPAGQTEQIESPVVSESTVSSRVPEQTQVESQEKVAPLAQEKTVWEEDPRKEETALPELVEAPLFQEVESAPIKVAEPEAAYSMPETGDLEAQVGEKLLDAVQTGDSKLEIQLEPEALGKVTVEIARFETGAVQIVLKAESLQTQSLLEKHLPSLQLLLADHGQKSAQVEIQHWQENQPADSHQNPYEGQNEGHSQRQQQERRQPAKQNDSFLHQLRLGLIPLDEVC
ncbi:MAG: hypothetical protein HFE86_03100 [Clostridiales bacterium]|nr:hypothetical protein [Clostridiales bacterium]